MFTIDKQLKTIRASDPFEERCLIFYGIYEEHGEEMFLYTRHSDVAKKIKYFTDDELHDLIPYYINMTPLTECHKSELDVMLTVINEVLNKRRINKILKLKDNVKNNSYFRYPQ